jgi:predicted RNase H-like HicB family nuclease|tara:strand:- start:13719 stop:13967 length:249 start_codon:yes stop_codon:yes gene_type:complete
MKSNIKVVYIKTADGKYVGWAEDYKGVVVEGNNLVELRKEIMISLKVIFQHFIDIIDDDTISVHCNKHHVSVPDESIDEINR